MTSGIKTAPNPTASTAVPNGMPVRWSAATLSVFAFAHPYQWWRWRANGDTHAAVTALRMRERNVVATADRDIVYFGWEVQP